MERSGLLVVTFKAPMVAGGAGTATAGTTQVATQVTMQVAAALRADVRAPRSREGPQTAAGIKNREDSRKAYREQLLSSGWLERTIPDKPRSRMQRYRLTAAGEAALREAGKG
jgi:hypothetical protein